MPHTQNRRRDDALLQAQRQLREDGALCIYGPPGVGKSAFIREVADSGVVVSARGVGGLDGLRRAIAGAMGVSWNGENPRDLHVMLGRTEHEALWIEDVDEVADVMGEELASLFGEGAQLTIITTSMQRLGTPFDFELHPLTRDEASALFIEVARRVMPAYEPDEEERASIDELLSGLDRLPLAIELAASRRPVLSPRDILDRLDARFELLRERRGRALENAVGWAWELLGIDLQDALTRLSTFVAPFSLAAAEAVLERGSVETLDVVEELRERCLMRVLPSAGESRFEIYQTVRGYVVGRSAELPVVAHAAYVLSAARAELDALDRGEGGSVARLNAMVPELSAMSRQADVAQAALLLDRIFSRTGTDAVRVHALETALEQVDVPDARARLLLARSECAVEGGRFDESAAWLQDALASARSAGDTQLEARALFRAGDVARRRGEAGDALFLLAQALEVATDAELNRLIRAHLGCCQVDHGMLEDARGTVSSVERGADAESLVVECEVRRRLAYVHFYLGNYAEQHRQGLAALDAAERAQHARLHGLCEQGLGDSATMLGNLDEAQGAYERALDVHRRLGDLHYEGVLLGNLGTVHHRCGRLDAASARYREALAIHRRSGARPYEAVVAMSLGLLEAERGRREEAEHHLVASAEASQELGIWDDVGAALLGRGWASVRVGEVDQALEHFAAATSAFERGGAHAWSAIAAYLSGQQSQAAASAVVTQHGGATEHELLAVASMWLGDTDGMDPSGQSLHVRVARVAVSSAGAAPPTVQPAVEMKLMIASDASWFDAGSGRVDLRRRRAHRLLLLELVRRHREHATPLDVFDAFDVGWPDEQAGAEAAADRVYWVIGTLRRLGLKEMLITADAGYQLAPGVEVSG